jgi:hypothetical protein
MGRDPWAGAQGIIVFVFGTVSLMSHTSWEAVDLRVRKRVEELGETKEARVVH